MAEPRVRCIHGHKLSDVGVYAVPRTGERRCRGCQAEASARHRKRKAAARPPRLCNCGQRLSKRARACTHCRAEGKRDYYIADADRAYVYKRDGHACLKCGAAENLTVDHILPRALGGLDLRDNYQTLCLSCNAAKGATYADYRHGSSGQMGLALQPAKPDLRARFLAKVDQRPNGCWIWTGAKLSSGTGAMKVDGKSVTAPRVAHELLIGPIEDGFFVYRTCDTRECVRHVEQAPAHIRRARQQEQALAS